MCSSRGLRLRLEMEQKTILVTTIIGSNRPGCVLQIMLGLLCLFALSLCSFHACVHPSDLLSLRFSAAYFRSVPLSSLFCCLSLTY